MRRFLAVLIVLAVAVPKAARAQTATPPDTWQVEFAPFYFWAAQLSGDMTVRNDTIPISLSFEDAAKHLAGTFTFHFEARKHRIGVMSDLMYMRLSTSSTFTLPSTAVVPGDMKLSNTLFQVGGTYLVVPARELSIVGGVRTYTISPEIDFTSGTVVVTPVDASKTVTDGFVGFTFRPKLAEKWILISAADIGAGGSKMSWSAGIGAEFRFKPWGGFVFGYKAYGIDVTNDIAVNVPTEYDVTQYGPGFGFNLHWGGK
jgi:hypothetical protein